MGFLESVKQNWLLFISQFYKNKVLGTYFLV